MKERLILVGTLSFSISTMNLANQQPAKNDKTIKQKHTIANNKAPKVSTNVKQTLKIEGCWVGWMEHRTHQVGHVSVKEAAKINHKNSQVMQ